MQHVSKMTRKGFTLVELLVVVAIISILLTLGAAGLRDAGGNGTTSALASSEALFDEARSIAIGKSTNARVIVDIDDPESEYYLRRIAVIYEELDDEGNPQENSWELAGRGYTFPDKTFFSREYSHTDHNSGSGDLDEMTLTGAGGVYDGRYLYYEFNSEGLCTTGLSGGSGDYNSPSYVIGAGVKGPGGQPMATGDARRDFKGFVIWRNGSTSVFREPSQIIGNDTPKEF